MKGVRPGLILMPSVHPRTGEIEKTRDQWCFDGTAHLKRHPRLKLHYDSYGILEFGTRVLPECPDLIVYRAGLDEANRLEDAGWHVVKRAMYYCFVTRGDKRNASPAIGKRAS